MSIKYFVGYDDNDVIRPLCIKLSQMIGYFTCFDSNKIMYFKVIDNKLLNKYTEIWGKVSSSINIKLDSKPIYGNNDKYIMTKIKTYEDKVNSNFQGKKIPRESASCKCLSLIMLGSVLRVWKTLLMMILTQVDLMNLTMDVIMNVIMMNLMISLLKIKTVF